MPSNIQRKRRKRNNKPAQTAAKVGFVDSSSLNKSLILIPSTFALYLAATSKTQTARIGFGVVGAAGIVYSLLPGQKGDGDASKGDTGFKDTPVTRSNVDNSVVDSFVSRFQSALAYSVCTDCMTLMKEYYELDRDNFIAVANKFKNKKGVSLKKDINNTSILQPFYFGTDWSKKVTDRMNQLNIP